jgi:hypothetical protein
MSRKQKPIQISLPKGETARRIQHHVWRREPFYSAGEGAERIFKLPHGGPTSRSRITHRPAFTMLIDSARTREVESKAIVNTEKKGHELLRRALI